MTREWKDNAGRPNRALYVAPHTWEHYINIMGKWVFQATHIMPYMRSNVSAKALRQSIES